MKNGLPVREVNYEELSGKLPLPPFCGRVGLGWQSGGVNIYIEVTR